MIITKLFLLFATMSFSSSADIQDRINDCERKGGGACLYSLLRELANNSGPAVVENKCKCSTQQWSTSSPCHSVSEYSYHLTRDGRTVEYKCGGSESNAYTTCIKEANKAEACK